ncbi:hypothetical protein LY28_03780 [Ruminiclostridium sufflavum DSM 19573]|uniref:Uncharacterized protein n=1 Tax=Ruminiclostridium sufflavum DSM 19573 TaxID=1121337 RepID=A0A318XHP3_9FIRM|nr:hypothetical protein [Ruminiclostridium sufflavum]PYG83895.1 hypothetical protein LY28_03780 [Ruminiclostridium sufflavum DSM 19573]
MDDKLFELIEKMYSEMKSGFSKIEVDVSELKTEIKNIGNQVMHLENDIKPKIEALFDGYKQNTETLERIEKEVSKQEEIIMRRVK